MIGQVASKPVSNIQVIFRKYDGALHWHFLAHRLGDDQHGVWLGISPPTVARRGTELAVELTEPAVILVPRDGWWTAQFCPTVEAALYVDVTTIPRWDDGAVTMVDLDLDVICWNNGTVVLEDEDEFAEHQVKYGYPPDVVKAAEAAAQELLAAIHAKAGPFGGAHERWLAEVSRP